MRYLIVGATGYVGGRLAPRLLGHAPGPAPEVRCLVRDPDKLRDVPWAAHAEIVRGDLLVPDDVRRACAGVDVVHLMAHSPPGSGLAAADRRAALLLAEAAREAGVRRIVHLGGLHPDGDPVHPASGGEVGEILLRSGVPTVVLQTAVILGSGSAGFEMLRHLTERLPVLVAPGWAHRRVQPIAVRDVLRYLVGAAGLPPEVHRRFDIGGPDVLTYLEMMQRYARAAGLPPRRVLPSRVLPGVAGALTPRLSAYGVDMLTPVPRAVVRPLIESLVLGAVCSEQDILGWIPDPPEGRLGYDRTVELALARTVHGEVQTRWSGAAVADAPADQRPGDPQCTGAGIDAPGPPARVYLDDRERTSTASPDRLWTVITGIGGERGWYSFPLAWRVRGWMDRLAGGPGLARGRRDPDELRTGDALDWWRVEEMTERGGERLLRLRAEMKVPGRAWLEMSVRPRSGGSTYHQRAVFVPDGLPGYLYWWSVAPFHGIVFGGMVRNIIRAAERSGGAAPAGRGRRPFRLRARIAGRPGRSAA